MAKRIAKNYKLYTITIFNITSYIILGSPDEIAAEVRVSPKQLDQPCSQDSLRKIAWFFPKWIEYAGLLGLSQQDINRIYGMDSQGMASRLLLSIWHKKNQHTSRGHYRVLVQVSCTLGYEDVAKSICELLKGKNIQLCAML